MAVKEEGYRGMHVELMEDIGDTLTKGLRGLCTADLQSYDRFAVWFDEPLAYAESGTPIHWVSFEWKDRDKFHIVGDRTEELNDALAPVMALIRK